MFQQDEFGRNGRIRLQLEPPMAVLVLAALQRISGAVDGDVQGRAASQGIGQSFYLLPDQAAHCNTFAAVNPDLMAPSIVAGKPVAVQSPAKIRFSKSVVAEGRRTCCVKVAANVALFSRSTR